MKAVFLIFLLTCGRVVTARDSKAAQGFAGCYALEVEGWQGWRLFRPSADDDLPRRFELTTRPIEKGFAVRNFDLKVRSDLPLSFWNMKDEGKIEIVWSTGYVGWNMQLSGSSANLRGTADYFTDAPSALPVRHKVIIHAVDCKTWASRLKRRLCSGLRYTSSFQIEIGQILHSGFSTTLRLLFARKLGL
jgi:hypothetical protein